MPMEQVATILNSIADQYRSSVPRCMPIAQLGTWINKISYKAAGKMLAGMALITARPLIEKEHISNAKAAAILECMSDEEAGRVARIKLKDISDINFMPILYLMSYGKGDVIVKNVHSRSLQRLWEKHKWDNRDVINQEKTDKDTQECLVNNIPKILQLDHIKQWISKQLRQLSEQEQAKICNAIIDKFKKVDIAQDQLKKIGLTQENVGDSVSAQDIQPYVNQYFASFNNKNLKFTLSTSASHNNQHKDDKDNIIKDILTKLSDSSLIKGQYKLLVEYKRNVETNGVNFVEKTNYKTNIQAIIASLQNKNPEPIYISLEERGIPQSQASLGDNQIAYAKGENQSYILNIEDAAIREKLLKMLQDYRKAISDTELQKQFLGDYLKLAVNHLLKTNKETLTYAQDFSVPTDTKMPSFDNLNKLNTAINRPLGTLVLDISKDSNIIFKQLQTAVQHYQAANLQHTFKGIKTEAEVQTKRDKWQKIDEKYTANPGHASLLNHCMVQLRDFIYSNGSKTYAYSINLQVLVKKYKFVAC